MRICPCALWLKRETHIVYPLVFTPRIPIKITWRTCPKPLCLFSNFSTRIMACY